MHGRDEDSGDQVVERGYMAGDDHERSTVRFVETFDLDLKREEPDSTAEQEGGPPTLKAEVRLEVGLGRSAVPTRMPRPERRTEVEADHLCEDVGVDHQE